MPLSKDLTPSKSTQEQERREVNWKEVAACYCSAGYIIHKRLITPDGTVKVYTYCIIEYDTKEPAEDLYSRVRIGTEPRQVRRYYRKKQFKSKSVAEREKRVWRWVIYSQLEVYWFLSNIQRFIRGTIRKELEKKLSYLEENLSLQGRLKKLKMTDSSTLNEPKLTSEHMTRSGFLNRTHL